jgi:hypothetical protein
VEITGDVRFQAHLWLFYRWLRRFGHGRGYKAEMAIEAKKKESTFMLPQRREL